MKPRPLILTAGFASLFALYVHSETTTKKSSSGVQLANFDREVRAQDDFFRHVNGTWLKTKEIPADKSRYASFTELADQAEVNLRKIIDEAAAQDDKAPGSDAQKVGDLFASFMNDARVNELDTKPLQADLDKVKALVSKDDLVEHLGLLQAMNISTPLGVYVDQDSKKSDEYIVKMTQSGLGLPDRDYYLNDSAKFTEIRKAYLLVRA